MAASRLVVHRWMLILTILPALGLILAISWPRPRAEQPGDAATDGRALLVPVSVDLQLSPFPDAHYHPAPRGTSLVVELGVGQLRMWELAGTVDGASDWDSAHAATTAVDWSSTESVVKAGMALRSVARLLKALHNPGARLDEVAVAVDAGLPWARVRQLLKQGLVFTQGIDLLWMCQRRPWTGGARTERDIVWIPVEIPASSAATLARALTITLSADGVLRSAGDGQSASQVGACSRSAGLTGPGGVTGVIERLRGALRQSGRGYLRVRGEDGSMAGCVGGVLECVVRLNHVAWQALE